MHLKHQPFLSRLLLLNVFFVVCCRVGWSLNRTGLCLFWLISCLPCERKRCQFAVSLEPAGLTHALQEPPVAGEEKGRDAWEVPCTKQGDQGAWSRNTESSTHSALLIAVLLHNRKKKVVSQNVFYFMLIIFKLLPYLKTIDSTRMIWLPLAWCCVINIMQLRCACLFVSFSTGSSVSFPDAVSLSVSEITVVGLF